MKYRQLRSFLYFMLFLISMLNPISILAEPIEHTPNISGENIDADICTESESDENIDADISIKSESEQDITTENIDTDECSESEDEVFSECMSIPYIPISQEPVFSFLDKPQEVISSGVERFAKALDEFFSEDKVFYDASGTYLKFTLDTTRDNNGDVHSSGDFRLKLRLPHTNEKIKLTIESSEEERPDDIVVKNVETPATTAEDNSYVAGIQAQLGKKENAWEFKPSIGMRLNSDINLHLKLRLSRKYQFEKWNFNWYETAYWYRTTGNGVDSHFEINKKLSEDDLFRASTFARWTNTTDYFELSQTFSMFHTLSKRRAVSYYVGAYGISEPAVYATHYVIGSSYRQNIHKDYLFFELIPQILYQKSNDFHAEFSLTFRIEMIFKK